MSDAETAALLVRHAQNLQASIEAQQAQIAVQHQKIDELLVALQPVPEKLGKLAFEGGQAAVTKAADKVFQGAAGEVISVTNELKRIKEEFSERTREALKWVVTLGIFAFVIAGLGAWFAYENALPVELASLRKEVAAKQSELDALQAKLPEMQRKAAELEAEGVNFQTAQCVLADKTERLCVEIEPDSDMYGLNGKRFYIPKMPSPYLTR